MGTYATDYETKAHESAWPRGRPWRLTAALFVPLLAFAGAWGSTVAWPDLSMPAAIMLGILLLAAGYWALEPISAVATALLGIALCVALLGLPATFSAPWVIQGAPSIKGWSQFIAPAGSPVMLLMLGSIAMAAGASRAGYDRSIGLALVRAARGRAGRLVPIILITSAFMAMWTSNTATGALMLTVTRPIWARRDPARGNDPTVSDSKPLAAACVMAVAVGANVGGIASPVGTPPCAIAFTALEAIGTPVTFLGWMALGLPITLILMVAGYAALRFRMPFDSSRIIEINLDDAPRPDVPMWARLVTAITFLVTVTLWVTSTWTGLPVEAVALVPLAVLPAAGVLRPRDIAHLDWDVLLLILGGLVLGVGMEISGLATWAVVKLPVEEMGILGLVAVVATVAIILSAFMSNTATANLLIPIGMAVAGAAGPHGGDEVRAVSVPLALAIAMGSGIAMMLPVASPANAMAYTTGAVTARQFLFVGTIVAVAGVACVIAIAAML